MSLFECFPRSEVQAQLGVPDRWSESTVQFKMDLMRSRGHIRGLWSVLDPAH